MTSAKIIVRLAGGLGNQLFQFSAAINLAKRLHLPFSNIFIDTRFLASYEAIHKYEIGFISDFFPGVQVSQNLPFLASLASRFRIAKIFDIKLRSYELISSVAHFNVACTSNELASTFILDGYFQHPDILFSGSECDQIRMALFAEKRPLVEQILKNSHTIGVHIRRGDYISSKSASKVFRNVPISYYDKALRRLGNNSKILIFSDDCTISASYAYKVGGIDVRQLNLSLQDEFCLLMCCNDHIIANSTFSWWATYLGHKNDGRVIAPKTWYKKMIQNQNNQLLLPHFELIDE